MDILKTKIINLINTSIKRINDNNKKNIETNTELNIM